MYSALRPTNRRFVDETNHVIILNEYLKSKPKTYKEEKLKEIMAAICAMLNTNGGKVVILIKIDESVPVQGSAFSLVSSVIRTLGQSLTNIIGLNQAISKTKWKYDEEKITLLIEKTNSLITTSYSLYLSNQKEVVHVSPSCLSEPPESVVRDIISRKKVEEPVRLYSHCRQFFKGKHCGLHENSTCQLKNVKAEQSKCTTIGDRLTCKSNKLSCYISAFANHSGGHVYFGINDNGFVEGEEISDEGSIVTKVEKAVNKMIWPEEIGQVKRGEHWEIFFEPRRCRLLIGKEEYYTHSGPELLLMKSQFNALNGVQPTLSRFSPWLRKN